jgi:hypothetical protein
MPWPTASADCCITSEVILIHLLGLNACPVNMPNVRSTNPLCRLSPALKVAFNVSPISSSVASVTLSKALVAFDGLNRFSDCWMPNRDIAHEKLNIDLVKSRMIDSFLQTASAWVMQACESSAIAPSQRPRPAQPAP